MGANETRGSAVVSVRDLIDHLAARRDVIPVEHAIAIVAGAAARANAERDTGRFDMRSEHVVVRFDGEVDVASPLVPREGDYRDDVVALGRLLAELLARPVDAPKVPVAVRDVVVAALDADPEHGFATPVGMASALREAARIGHVTPSRRELGRWVRRIVRPAKLAHTVRRDERETTKLEMEDLLGLGVSPAALGIEAPIDDETLVDDNLPERDVFDGLLSPDPQPLPLPPISLLASPPPPPAIETQTIRSLGVRARRGIRIAVSAVAIAAIVVLASGATGHAVSNRTPPAAAAAPPAPEPAPMTLAPLAAPAPDVPPADDAIARCERRLRSTSRRIRIACAITACKNDRPDLHAAFVDGLSKPRRAAVARACRD
jgi:hypothetical protein